MSVSWRRLRGRPRYRVEEKVSKYWPEFAANGKEDTKVWHILSHASGLPHWTLVDEKTTVRVSFSHERVLAAFAWPPQISRTFFPKVSKYWPEFAANGKEDTKVWHILSHASGLPHWDALMRRTISPIKCPWSISW
jgi:CubicO group peptidase (beta-lactamase class C family)